MKPRKCHHCGHDPCDINLVEELKEEIFKLNDRLIEKDISIKVLGEMKNEEIKELKLALKEIARFSELTREQFDYERLKTILAHDMDSIHLLANNALGIFYKDE